MSSISKYLNGSNVLLKCSEAISGIFCYNLLAETLIVFGLIANYLVERVLSFVNFVLTEKSEHRFYI